MAYSLSLIKNDLLPAYMEQVPQGLQAAFEALQDADISTDTFSFYTSVSSVFSSKIEGRILSWTAMLNIKNSV